MTRPLLTPFRLLGVTVLTVLLLNLSPADAVAHPGHDHADDQAGEHAGVERAAPGGAPPGGSGTVEVSGPVRVIDGDTLEVEADGSRFGVGLVGVDAPRGNTACGEEAAEKLRSLVGDGVRLEEAAGAAFDARERRMYRVETPAGGSVAAALVESGVARAAGRGREAGELATAQTEAREAGEGCLWGDSAPADERTRGEKPGLALGQARLVGLARAWGLAADLLAAVAPDALETRPAQAQDADGFAEDVVARGLDAPTAFAFLPDGGILIAEKSGVVRLHKDGALRSTPFIDVRDRVNDYWDRGLLVIAVDPDFANNGYVYLLYTYEDDRVRYEGTKTARLTRVTAMGETASPASETVILGKTVGASCKDFPAGADCIPSDSPSHSVGNVKFASDGSLFATVGDASNFSFVDDDALRVQDLASLAGKVIRVDRDGAGLPSNPFFTGSAADNRSKVWASGVRNGFRFNLRPGTDVPYLGDVGWDSWEEIDVATKGANLGWPCYEGPARQAGYEPKPVCQTLYAAGPSAVKAPLVEWAHNGGTASAVGGAFYTGTAYPEEYRGAYLYGDYAKGWMRSLRTDETDRLTAGPTGFKADAGGPVDIEAGPDGSIHYLSIYTGELRKIRYGTAAETTCPTGQYKAEYYAGTALGGQPATTRCEPAIDNGWANEAPPDAGVGPDNFSARWTGRHYFEAGDYTFTARADDGVRVFVDGEQVISDGWKDQPETTYQATRTLGAGEHEVRMEYYENGGGAVAKLGWGRAAANAAPVPTFESPAPTYKWKVGDVINFSASATDPEDGAVPAEKLSWQVILQHCPGGECHYHPYISGKGAGGSFKAPDHGDESYFQLKMTATDSAGKEGTTTMDLRPLEARVTLDTSPGGLEAVYDGKGGPAPLTRTTIVGSTHTIYAPPPRGGGAFESWSDGGAQQHAITVGEGDATYTARFSGASLVSNPGFEDGLASWDTWSPNGAHDDADYTEGHGGAHAGALHGTHWKPSAPYETATAQTRTDLPNGVYTMRAWVKGSGGQTWAGMYAKNYGGDQQWRDIPATAGGEFGPWREVVIPNINVTNGRCEFGFYSLADAGQWIYFDDVEFYRQP